MRLFFTFGAIAFFVGHNFELLFCLMFFMALMISLFLTGLDCTWENENAFEFFKSIFLCHSFQNFFEGKLAVFCDVSIFCHLLSGSKDERERKYIEQQRHNCLFIGNPKREWKSRSQSFKGIKPNSRMFIEESI